MNEAMLHATFAGKLPALWIVDVSESGYMDEKVFRKCVGQLSKLRRVDALGNKEKICAILDGHYSHMDADLWKQALEEEGIFCFIIAAHTSVLTQVGDNGPNSVLKSLYDVYLEEVKMQIGGLLKMDVSLFNEVFRRTWQWACTKIPLAAAQAAINTGWYYDFNHKLLGAAAENYRGIASLSYALKGGEGTLAQAESKGDEVKVARVLGHSTVYLTAPLSTPGVLVVRAVALEAIEKSRTLPAQEIAAALVEVGLQKMVKVGRKLPGTRLLKSTGTLTGL